MRPQPPQDLLGVSVGREDGIEDGIEDVFDDPSEITRVSRLNNVLPPASNVGRPNIRASVKLESDSMANGRRRRSTTSRW